MRNNQSRSIYSIYHNSLPFYLDRADICMVDEGTQGFPNAFMEELLSWKLSKQVFATSLAADKLRHLYFESRNYEKIHGAKSFGIGFPLMIDTFNSDLVVGPVFIWQLQLEPAQTKVDAWVIKPSEQRHILPNYRLMEHFKEKYGYDFTEKAEALAYSKSINLGQLSEFCNEIAARLNFTVQGSSEELVPSPGIDEIGSFTESGTLHWSGVLGLYPPQNYQWQPSKMRPEEVFVPSLDKAPEEKVFAYQHDDPEQTSALEKVAAQKMTAIVGEDALGKTQTLVNLLVNALSNGKRCLVVSERSPSLKFAQDLLAKAGFFQFHYLLDDALNDKATFLELLRSTFNSEGREVKHNEQAFNAAMGKFLTAKANVQASYLSISQKVFGSHNWTETVGLFLSNNRIEGKEKLASHLHAVDFGFSPSEHEQIVTGIVRSEPLFDQIKTLSHPLGSLNDQIFVNSEARKSQQFVETNLRLFIAKTNELQTEYIQQVDNYAARLKAHYREYQAHLDALAKSLQERIQNHTALLGSGFASAGSSAFEWPSFFSSKKKKIKLAQEEVAKSFRGFQKTYQIDPYFEAIMEPCKEGMNIPVVVKNLSNFRSSLAKWYSNADSLVQDEVMRLNSKTAHASLDVKEQVTTLEFALDSLIEELNESGLYQKLFENKTLTIPQRQKYLESIMEQLENTQLNMRDFQAYHAWQTNWLALGVLGQKVVRALVKVKPGNWVAAFESWYFNSLLTKVQTSALPIDSKAIDDYREAWTALKPLIFNQTIYHWQKQQSAAARALKKKNREAWQMIFEKSASKLTEQAPLSKIWEHSFEAVTAYFPVLFASPHVVLNEMPQLPDFFDYVIFDEANKFSIETATSIVPLGKKTVIMGSNDSYGNETSLLQYALENGVPQAVITNRYEPPRPVHILEEGQDALSLHQTSYASDFVEGRFHELLGTNDTEAQAIVRLLNQIKPTPQRVYPSVGVVTFTVEQRDLIANYLLKLKQQNAVGGEKIQQLERNGMGIFHLDELFGQFFDILIVSCTYGLVNQKGEMTKKLAFLNTPNEIGNLRMLVNKPAQTFYLVHSFPEDHLQQMEGKKWEEGTWTVAHIIRLAEATKNENKPQAMLSLEALGKKPAVVAPNSIFAEEVLTALAPFMEVDRISTNVATADIHLPMLVRPKGGTGKGLVLHPDGYFAGTEFTSPLWEQGHRDTIARSGLEYLPIWSVNWLKNPVMEAKLLASRIINLDAAQAVDDAEISLEDKLDGVG